VGAILCDHKRDYDGAVACFRTAIALDPKFADAHNNLGNALRRKGEVDAAIACYQKAVELDPKYAKAHDNLGRILGYVKRDYDGAIASFRAAIALDPKFARAHNGLGAILCDHKRDYDGAISCFRTAIELEPKNATIHSNLGVALRHKGHVAAAIASYQKAVELDPMNAKACTGLAQAKRLAAVHDKLPAFLTGDFKPTTSDERLALSEWCEIRKLYRTSAGLFADAFTADPKLAEDLEAGHLYDAARLAALAAAGQGEDATQLDDKERARLRQQSLAWLRARLAVHTQRLESGQPPDRAQVQQIVRNWQEVPDLASVRDAAALARLSPVERTAWTQFWADVAAFLNKAVEGTK
jgi:Flp pilus assembly protein TadD